jgi:hypothetical protein
MVGTDLTLVYKLMVGESWCRVGERDVRGWRSRKATMAFTSSQIFVIGYLYTKSDSYSSLERNIVYKSS